MIKARYIIFAILLIHTINPHTINNNINVIDEKTFDQSKFKSEGTYSRSTSLEFIEKTNAPIWDNIWEHTIISTHFEVHYNTTGGNKTTHEYAQATKAALEYSWFKVVQDYGFAAPPDSYIHVYIYDCVNAQGFEGQTTHIRENDLPHIKCIEIDNDLDANQLNYVCSHEFFHCVQASSDLIERYIWENESSTLWVREGTATWMGSKVFPEWKGGGSYVEYANIYLGNTNRHLTFLSYDAVLLWIFIDENYGGHNTVKYLMQRDVTYNTIQALNTTLYSYQSTTFENVYKEWTIANYLNDIYYTDGEYFNTPSKWDTVYNGIENEVNSIVIDWGADYWYIDVNEAYTATISMPIHISSSGSDNVTVLLFDNGLPVFFDIELNSFLEGSFTLMQANNLDNIILILRSTGTQTSMNNVDYTITLQDSSYILNGPSQNTSPSPRLISSNTYTGSESSLTELFISNRTGESNSCDVKTLVAGEKGFDNSCDVKTLVAGEKGFDNSSSTTLQVRGNNGILLYSGWNLIGVPFDLEDPLTESVFSSNLTYVDAIYGYANGAWTYWFPVSSTLDELECGRGYWVLANDNFTVTFTGTLGDAPTMVEGWNLVAINSSIPVYTTDYLAGSSWTVAYGYDAQSESWSYYINGVGGSLDTLQLGEGYWVLIETE